MELERFCSILNKPKPPKPKAAEPKPVEPKPEDKKGEPQVEATSDHSEKIPAKTTEMDLD